MIDFEGYIANKSFFAAANGFSGFKSIFNEVLKRNELSRLFILKGGPGTGKSSIMKAIIKYANQEGIYAEAIWCSSDTNSLDGVILTDGDKSVAVIDGTSPHTMDPVYPGARDEIINLGDSFDILHLKKHSEKIYEYTAKKSGCYKDAYRYLEMAGKMHRFICEKYEEKIDGEAIDALVESILSSVKAEESNDAPHRYLISAFGKDGEVRLSDCCEENKNCIRISGDGYTEFIVMERLCSQLSHCTEAYCPTPLSERQIEAIYTPRHLFITDKSTNGGIDSTVIMAEKAELLQEKRIYNELLKLAKDAFARAAEWHFMLEDIYKGGMNFSNNDTIFNKLIKDIERELC